MLHKILGIIFILPLMILLGFIVFDAFIEMKSRTKKENLITIVFLSVVIVLGILWNIGWYLLGVY